MDNNKLSNPPVNNADRSIIIDDLTISAIPNSFRSTAKVATHGKYIDKTTDATISCFNESCKGISIPTARSFRKNPITNAPAASSGNPKK